MIRDLGTLGPVPLASGAFSAIAAIVMREEWKGSGAGNGDGSFHLSGVGAGSSRAA